MNIPPYDPANPLDELTGLLKRARALERIEERIAGGNEFSLIFADIDRCAHVNYDYGPAAGDSAIRSLGHVIRDTAGEGAVVGRYGGDEYLICLPSTSASTARDVAEKMRASAREAKAQDHEGKQIPVPSLTFGVAGFPDCGPDLQALIASLEAAVHAGKRAGGDCVVIAGA